MAEPTQHEQTGPLAQALTHEHHAIDAGIEAFMARSDDATGPISEWAGPLTEAMQALRRHIYLEEAIVFPRLPKGPLMMPIMVMKREHGELWRAMDELDVELASPDAEQEPKRSELVGRCREMLQLLENHNSKEEPVIYPHLDTSMDWTAQAQLREFLAEGTTPDGWTCERA